MKYISLFDGIGAAHVAWQPLGFECLAVAEIDKHCNAVVANHFSFPNLGDVTKLSKEDITKYGQPDIIIGGPPCQSFSCAGKRQGIHDKRGSMLFQFVRIILDIRPRWFVVENVVGLLSSDDGDTFARFIHTFEECGYGVAWRVLDAQFFGVPQRRRRVFVVGCLGNATCAGKVLFDGEHVQGDTETDKATQKNAARTVAKCIRASRGGVNEATPIIAETITRIQCRSSGIKQGNNYGIKNPVIENNRVRKLTPREHERLQGFPDDYTLVPFGSRMMSDTQRYMMTGNSMAVPVVRWIGERIRKYHEN